MISLKLTLPEINEAILALMTEMDSLNRQLMRTTDPNIINVINTRKENIISALQKLNRSRDELY